MKSLKILFFAVIFIFAFQQCGTELKPNTEETQTKKTETPQIADFALVIHGGAGTILKKNMTDEQEKAYREKLNEALSVGEKILKEGGSSMDAVTQTIMVMENSPLFNAGKGAVFTNEGINEMDASFMEGKTMNAGAVGGLTVIKNPILAARAVMEKSEHVLLTGNGAETFAKEQGIEVVDTKYFYTDRRWKSLERAKKTEKVELSESEDEAEEKKHGTVGCVALDKEGNLAAGTSEV
jgi:beta-aspartyl-peptidase (threonine type)